MLYIHVKHRDINDAYTIGPGEPKAVLSPCTSSTPWPPCSTTSKRTKNKVTDALHTRRTEQGDSTTWSYCTLVLGSAGPPPQNSARVTIRRSTNAVKEKRAAFSRPRRLRGDPHSLEQLFPTWCDHYPIWSRTNRSIAPGQKESNRNQQKYII